MSYYGIYVNGEIDCDPVPMIYETSEEAKAALANIDYDLGDDIEVALVPDSIAEAFLDDAIESALSECRKAYNDADFSGPFSAIIGEDLYDRLWDNISIFMEGSGALGDFLNYGHIIYKRFYSSRIRRAQFIEDLRLATEILKGVC